MGGLLAIALNDIRILLRDRMGAFFTFVFPLVMSIFFGMMFGGGGPRSSGLRVLALDQDGTPGSAAFLKDVEDGHDLGLAIAPPPPADAGAAAAARETAIDRVRDGEFAALVVLPRGFGAARPSPFSGESLRIEVAVDPSRRAAGPMIEGVLTKYAVLRVQRAFAGPDAGAPAWRPLAISPIPIERAEEPHAKNAYEVSFPQGIIWGVIGCTLTFAVAFVTERSRGTMSRLRAAPLAARTILGGKALAAFATTVVVAAALMLVAAAAFHVRPRSYAMVAAAVLATAFCFSGVMMLIAAVSRTERSASGLGWGVLMICAMVGGGMIPLEFLPEWIAPVSNLSPIRWSIFAIQCGIWRPVGWGELLLPLGILLGLGCAGFAVGVKAFASAEGT